MTDATQTTGAATPATGRSRLAVGLLQGLALWGLTEAVEQKVWPATQGPVFGALAMMALLAPFVVLGGLGGLRQRTLIVWSLAAAALLALLGAHDIYRRGAFDVIDWVGPAVMGYGAAGLFIGHHLIAGADADRRFIGRFATYFDIAWKHGVQLVLAAGFVGVFWLVLFLGAALFKLIGIGVVQDIIEERWFAFPATTTMFAAAVQLTDVRHGLIRGIRTVALTLLSWLLPVLVGLAAAFLMALPFTGLEPLWGTRRATAILLSASAVLIILINAAYQDGQPDTPAPLLLRWAAKIGGVLLAPMTVLATYALGLRIGQYGLTPDRVVAAACVFTGLCYAAGYGWAAVRPGIWMKRLEITNVAVAFVVLGLLLALFTPIADPARLGVNDQMARLKAGRVTPEAFDYAFLRFDGQRYGRAALERLVKQGGEAGKRAAAALAAGDRGDLPDPARPVRLPVFVEVLPKGRALPAGFLDLRGAANDGGLGDCTEKASPCLALLVDLDGDAREEVVLSAGWVMLVSSADANGRWRQVGHIGDPCADTQDALRSGRVRAIAPVWRDLELEGRRLRFQADESVCPVKDGAPTSEPRAGR